MIVMFVELGDIEIQLTANFLVKIYSKVSWGNRHS